MEFLILIGVELTELLPTVEILGREKLPEPKEELLREKLLEPKEELLREKLLELKERLPLKLRAISTLGVEDLPML